MIEKELRDTPAYIRQLLAKRFCDACVHDNPRGREQYLKNYSRLYTEHFLTREMTIKMNKAQFNEFCKLGKEICHSGSPYGDGKLIGHRFIELADSFYELVYILKNSGVYHQGLYSLLEAIETIERLVELQERILNTSLSYLRLCISEQITETKTGLKSIVYAYYKHGDMAIEKISDFIKIDKGLEVFAIIDNPTVNGRKCVCFTS